MTIEIRGVRYFTATDVQESLGIARQTLWRWRKAKKIPQGLRYRTRQILFSEEEVEQIRGFADQLEPALLPVAQKRERGGLA
jgi:predicted DNA-binding transcriptional regulator AlpA